MFLPILVPPIATFAVVYTAVRILQISGRRDKKAAVISGVEAAILTNLIIINHSYFSATLLWSISASISSYASVRFFKQSRRFARFAIDIGVLVPLIGNFTLLSFCHYPGAFLVFVGAYSLLVYILKRPGDIDEDKTVSTLTAFAGGILTGVVWINVSFFFLHD